MNVMSHSLLLGAVKRPGSVCHQSQSISTSRTLPIRRTMHVSAQHERGWHSRQSGLFRPSWGLVGSLSKPRRSVENHVVAVWTIQDLSPLSDTHKALLSLASENML